jgi:hypothetical protein
MDTFLIVVFVVVVASVIVRRKKPELWSKIKDKIKVWK